MDKDAILNEVRQAAYTAYAMVQKTLPYKTGLLSSQPPASTSNSGGFRIEDLGHGDYRIYIDVPTVPYVQYLSGNNRKHKDYLQWDKQVDTFASIMAAQLNGKLRRKE